MTARLHIYVSPAQNATHWVMDWPKGGRKMHFRLPGNLAVYTDCCAVRRQCKNLHVRAYYDLTQFFCKPGKGCKRCRA